MADTTKQQADQSFFVFVKDTNTGKIRRMAIPGDVQIGLKDNPAELQLHGRFSWAARDYSITSANKGILYVPNNDTIISVTLVDTPPTNRITLYLPANPRDGQLHFIKDMSGTADSVPIDVVPSPGAKIDQYDSRTLTDKYGSIALYWFGDRWRILVSGLGLISIGAADSAATYITLSGNTTLTNERRLNVSGSNLQMVDTGPNATIDLDLTQILGGGAGTFTYATVTADAFGRITAISAGANPPPASASYITVTNEPALTGERALAAGVGIQLVDAGANSSITAQINNNVVATLTGSTFSGPVIAGGGLSGSLSKLPNGLSYLVAGPGLTIFTSSTGQIMIGSPWTNNGTSLMTTSSVSIDGQGRFPSTIGLDVYFYVSGTVGVTTSSNPQNARVALFGGDVHLSGALNVGGLSLYTGSCTITTASLSHIFGVNNLNLSQTGSVDWFSPSGSYFQNYRGLGAGNGKASCGVIHNSFDWVNPGIGTGFTQSSGFTISSTAGDDVGTAMSSVTTDAGVFSAGGTNYGYRFRAPSGPSTRTLRIYNSVWSGGVLVTVRAGDGSFPTRTYFLSSAAATSVSYVWNIVYNTTTTSEIYVTCLLTSNLGSTPNIKLMGVTVTSGVQ